MLRGAVRCPESLATPTPTGWDGGDSWRVHVQDALPRGGSWSSCSRLQPLYCTDLHAYAWTCTTTTGPTSSTWRSPISPPARWRQRDGPRSRAEGRLGRSAGTLEPRGRGMLPGRSGVGWGVGRKNPYLHAEHVCYRATWHGHQGWGSASSELSWRQTCLRVRTRQHEGEEGLGVEAERASPGGAVNKALKGERF